MERACASVIHAATVQHSSGPSEFPLPMTKHPVVEPLVLHLRSPFRTAHGTSTTRTNALVRLADGLGEAGLPPYYPHRVEDVAAYVQGLDEATLRDDPAAPEHTLAALPDGPAPAKAAVDLALHDRWGKHLGQPLYRLWGLSPERAAQSTITISFSEDEAVLRDQVQTYRDWPLVKLKLGGGDVAQDLALVRIAQETTQARLCVDANGGWSVDEAAQIIPQLGAQGVAFVEQPIRSNAFDDWQRLRLLLPPDAPPIIADESIQALEDVLRLHAVVDGINVKLAKAGGLRGARQQIYVARALGLRVMIGCMIESAIAITAAAHLAPLADVTDLDGMLHVAQDRFAGVRLAKGRLHLPDRPGIGVEER